MKKFAPYVIAVVIVAFCLTFGLLINGAKPSKSIAAHPTTITGAKADFIKYPSLVGQTFQAGFDASHKAQKLIGVVGCGAIGKNTYVCRFIGRQQSGVQCIDIELTVADAIRVKAAKSQPLSACGLS